MIFFNVSSITQKQNLLKKQAAKSKHLNFFVFFVGCAIFVVISVLSATSFKNLDAKIGYTPYLLPDVMLNHQAQSTKKIKVKPVIKIEEISDIKNPFGEEIATDIDVNASAAVLMDAKSRKIIYKKNCDQKLPMASTTKIMTALTVLDTLSLDDSVTVPAEATGIEGSSIYLEVGETVSVKTLLQGLLLESGNDAATALALVCDNSIEAFAERMNRKAASLGLLQTHFTNPHGLHDENHFTTAKELAIIACAAMENDFIVETVSAKSVMCGGKNSLTEGEKARRFVNHNKLLWLYNGTLGIKTGYTKAAGRCLVSCAQQNGSRFIAVTLNCPDDWNTHIKLFEDGFNNYKSAELISSDGVDISPFGIYSKVYSENSPFATFKKDDNSVFSYRLTYKNGSGKISVSKTS